MKNTTKMPSQRQLRVGEQIRHIIAETLQRGHFHEDSLLEAGKVTVTEVRISPDLKNASAFVIALGGDDMDAILPALNREHHIFQKEVNRQTNLKFTPKITFKSDNSYDQAQRIEGILQNLHYAPEHEEDQ